MIAIYITFPTLPLYESPLHIAFYSSFNLICGSQYDSSELQEGKR